MITAIKKKRNPEWYQGNPNSPSFEGWYFKIVDANEQNLFAIIPGVYISRTPAESYAFIQVFDGVNNRAFYQQFPLTAFSAARQSFDIKIGDNSFSTNKMVLDLNQPELQLTGTLFFDNPTPWPKTWLAPGIMGWYTWAPFMQCYHGIVSLNHSTRGSMCINGRGVDFTGGKGYIEKDWGRSFPEAWIWCQSNHFTTENVSLTGAIAIIPWLRQPFLGVIFGLWFQNRLYRFATYSGAKLVDFELDDSHVRWVLRQRPYQLEVTATRSAGSYLQAPTLNGMSRKISESLQSTVTVKLFEITKHQKTLIFADTGRHAGFEIAGDLQRLLKMIKKSI